MLAECAGGRSSSSCWHATGRRTTCSASSPFSSRRNAFRAHRELQTEFDIACEALLDSRTKNSPCAICTNPSADNIPRQASRSRRGCRGHLYCALTGQLVQATVAAAKSHLKGGKFGKAKGGSTITIAPVHT